jgi:ribosomal protein L15
LALAAVTLREIEEIFAVLDRLGISREAVVIPLRPVHPGSVRVLANGKVEITVESQADFAAWLPELERMLRDSMHALA